MSSSVRDAKDLKEKRKRRTLKADTGSSGTEIKKLKTDPSKKKLLFYAEEEEVEHRDPQKDLQLHKKSSNEIRRVMQDVHGLKSEPDKNELSIEDRRIHGSLQFVALKKLNRLAHMRCKKVRDGTFEAKQRIDQHHLQLQNLLYEVMHLQKEINKCLEFKSKDEEIDLVPVEEFYKEAPSDISKSEITNRDPHQQTLARLDWELEQRKQLSVKLKESQSNKELISQEIKTKKEYLESLQPKLNSILHSTLPVQQYLGMPFDEIREQHKTARYLPRPLYVLYMQASAYKDACDKHISVSIEGDLDVAKALDNASPDIDEDSDSDQEEQEKKKSKRRRRTTGERMEQKRLKLLRKYPLSVLLIIKCKDGSALQLTFFYLVSMEIVTVSVKLSPGPDTTVNTVAGGDLLSPDYLLSSLYADDHGDDTPNPSNQFLLNRLGMDEFGTYISQVGRPYMWVQWLAGLEFLNDTCTERAQASVSALHMEESINRLRQRVKARLSLQKQLASLERCSVSVSSEFQSMFPTKQSTKLSSWKRSTYEDFMDVKYTRSIVDSGLAQPSDMFFVAVMERGTAKATVQVVVSDDYPNIPPMFATSLLWKTGRSNLNDDNIRVLEGEVNIHYGDLTKQNMRGQLLTNQVQRLLMCLDVYLETEADNSSLEGPLEFSKENIYSRTTRGRNRVKPYKFNPQLGFFTQR